MMLESGWVTDIVTNRSKALKVLGNGVVPPQAEHAIRALIGGTDATYREFGESLRAPRGSVR